MGKIDLVQFESAEALAQAAAREWLESITAFLRTQPQGTQPSRACGTAFSGGRIAERLFDAIASEAQHRKITLPEVHFFWADERCVPPEHPDSNYRLARTHLLQPLRIAASQIHRIKGELGPVAAAREASVEFSRLVPASLDFVFLGMGEDGHVASIFPGDPLAESPAEHYRPVFNAPKPPPERVTLAMHALVAAKNVRVIVSGVGKENTLGKSLRGDATPLGKLLKVRDLREFLPIFARND